VKQFQSGELGDSVESEEESNRRVALSVLEDDVARSNEDDPCFVWHCSYEDDTCSDCLSLDGTIKRLSQWKEFGLPSYAKTKCGAKCECRLGLFSYTPDFHLYPGKAAFLLCDSCEVCQQEVKTADTERIRITLDTMIETVLARWNDIDQDTIASLKWMTAEIPPAKSRSNLVYALRISKKVPDIKSMATLSKRWRTANDGAGMVGLAQAVASSDKDRVCSFLADLYLQGFERLAQEIMDKAAATAEKRKTAKTKAGCWTKAQEKIIAAGQEFTPELPGVGECIRQFEADCNVRASEATG
ncbi:MAG: hypothetical protein QGH94_12925, partial [Phycisphaerae bacterium]|nr:hypothetical protein [Phycisphaerae bacterium]